MESSEFYLNRVAQASPEIRVEPGHSGYFNAPDSRLDPNLFHGDVLRPEVREGIINRFYEYMQNRYRGAYNWSRLWLAGSGISYQWAGDRGNGDLDVMVGVDPVTFRRSNPTMAGLSNAELADWINAELKRSLWPTTAETRFGGKTYELTFYWNVDTDASPGGVKAIHPYAAYDVTGNTWTIRPPQLPADPHSLYPAEWWKQINAEAQRANTIIGRYNDARHRAASTTGPGHVNAMTELRIAASQAAALFDDIHKGRQAAFGPDGAGYGDWANFRWQAHKSLGTGPALAEITSVARSGRQEADVATYGSQVEDAAQARVKALLWANRGIQR
ncbi:hypothetical protein [Microbispora sp. NPDC049633]|uniref:hypothetical protein n=1 Tax=Microbispora sp. NPDC049633 TaxID=3154355 RepID=UPI00341BA09B